MIAIFTQYDENGDLSLTQEEFTSAVGALGVEWELEQIEEVFQQADRDNQGIIEIQDIEQISFKNHTI